MSEAKSERELDFHLHSRRLQTEGRFPEDVYQRGRQVRHALHSIDIARNPRHLLLDERKVTDWAVELYSGQSILDGVLQEELRDSNCRSPHREAAAAEDVHGQFEALSDIPKHVLHRDGGVVEGHGAS